MRSKSLQCICIHLYVCMPYTYILFIHSSVNEHLGRFHILAIINNTAINLEVHISFWDNDFISFRYMCQKWNCWITDCKEIQPVHSEGDQPWDFFGRNDAKAETPAHWKRLWCWEGLGAGGEGDDRGWDGWMASQTRWTWVWVNSGRWWWTGRPGVLPFMGSQRVGHDWVTELNWTDGNSLFNFLRDFFTVLHHDCTNLHPYQQSTRFPFSSQSPALVISCRFDDSHSNRHGMKSHCGSDLWCWLLVDH